MPITRRDFLLTSSAAAAGIVTSASVATSAAPPPDTPPALVFAHLTDMHLKPEGAGPEGLARCLRQVHAHPDKPEFILNGGDAIMSALGATEERTRTQWEFFHELMERENSLEMYNMIGNHDIWGWQRTRAGTTGDEPLYGKAWALKELNLERGYYNFQRGGWHFIVLDSVQERGGGAYLPVIDDAQFDWLVETIEATPEGMPVIIASHVPILSVTPFFFRDDVVENWQFRLSGALMHQDVQRLVHMLRDHDNVKLLISGHSHIVDSVVFEGKPYVCNGAVSGSWWHGPHRGCNPGYALMKLWPDGTFHREYIEYLDA